MATRKKTAGKKTTAKRVVPRRRTRPAEEEPTPPDTFEDEGGSPSTLERDLAEIRADLETIRLELLAVPRALLEELQKVFRGLREIEQSVHKHLDRIPEDLIAQIRAAQAAKMSAPATQPAAQSPAVQVEKPAPPDSDKQYREALTELSLSEILTRQQRDWCIQFMTRPHVAEEWEQAIANVEDAIKKQRAKGPAPASTEQRHHEANQTGDGKDARCPKCGSEMWDNRLTKRNPRAPDFKCRDRTCDGVMWPGEYDAHREGNDRPARPLVDSDEKFFDDQDDDLPF
jgi:hypothetical protein